MPLRRHQKEAQAEDQIGQGSSRNKENRLIAEAQPSNTGGALSLTSQIEEIILRDLERQRSTYTQLLDKYQTGMIFTFVAKTSQVKGDKKVKDMSPVKSFH